MSGINGSIKGFNLYVYCFNNPTMYSDSMGNWPQWLEDTWDWIVDKYETWKEESFVYNVITKNITTDLGFGFGVGGELKVGPVEFSAISRIDVFGFETQGHDIRLGHYGKSALGIGVNDYSIGVETKTFEPFDGRKREIEQSIPEIAYSLGGEIGVIVAAHGSISISFSGIYNSFIKYAREHNWWE